MHYCQKCTAPLVSVNLILDDDGVCSACQVQEEFNQLPPEIWQQKQEKFQELVDCA